MIELSTLTQNLWLNPAAWAGCSVVCSATFINNVDLFYIRGADNTQVTAITFRQEVCRALFTTGPDSGWL
jgi:hypothetical protein